VVWLQELSFFLRYSCQEDFHLPLSPVYRSSGLQPPNPDTEAQKSSVQPLNNYYCLVFDPNRSAQYSRYGYRHTGRQIFARYARERS
jgi:hypothetical protein